MPYTIITKTPPTTGAMACCASTIAAGTCGHMLEQSRVAVATIEDVREWVRGEIEERDSGTSDAEWSDVLVDLTDTRSTIGPMPDGTVIDVQSVTWAELMGELLDADSRPPADIENRIIDVYNELAR